jgi:peptide deformylase
MNTFDRRLELKIYPDSVLRQICEPVERFDTELRQITNEMFELMLESEGIGLAASQVGISKEFFICKIESESLCLVNPTIIEVDSQVDMIEGCLSLPDICVRVTRNERIIVAGFDLRGRKIQYGLTGLWARVVQHEMDHLKGLLICDYGENVSMEQRNKEGCDHSGSSDKTVRVIDESREDQGDRK